MCQWMICFEGGDARHGMTWFNSSPIFSLRPFHERSRETVVLVAPFKGPSCNLYLQCSVLHFLSRYWDGGHIWHICEPWLGNIQRGLICNSRYFVHVAGVWICHEYSRSCIIPVVVLADIISIKPVHDMKPGEVRLDDQDGRQFNKGEPCLMLPVI